MLQSHLAALCDTISRDGLLRNPTEPCRQPRQLILWTKPAVSSQRLSWVIFDRRNQELLLAQSRLARKRRFRLCRVHAYTRPSYFNSTSTISTREVPVL